MGIIKESFDFSNNQSMTIGIDASRANKENKTGTEWYSFHIIEELKKTAPKEVKFRLYTNEPLKGALAKCPENFQQRILSWPPKYLWTQLRLWFELIINPPNVLFVPAHTIPFLPIRKKTRVCVNVHDVGFKRFPELYKPIQVYYHDLTMRKIKNRADVIITISEFSKKEIMELYDIEEKKIAVVYLGYDEAKYYQRALGEAGDVLSKYKISEPYLLYVGRLEKKKNIGNMIKAFALAKDHLLEKNDGGFHNLKLVLAGASGNQYELVKSIIAEYGLETEVLLPGYIEEEDLPVIISKASLFLFPTLYEGFGLPIIQAMACGTPVLTSNINPHMEIAGEAAAFADPNSPEKMADKIIELVNEEGLRLKMIEKGLERVRQFTWYKTAEAIFKILSSKEN